MRRAEIVLSIKKIIDALEASEIGRLLQNSLRDSMERGNTTRSTGENSPISQISQDILKSLNKYSISAQSFSSVEKGISTVFDLDNLTNLNGWPILISTASTSNIRRTKAKMLTDIKFFIEYLPKVIDLYKQEHTDIIERGKEEEKSIFYDKSIISVIMIEEENQLSNIDRLRQMLDGVSLLYDTCTKIQNYNNKSIEDSDRLIVLACDSGSDKSFDFLGVTKGIEQLKEVILSIWDRIVFHRERQSSERLNLINESIPVLVLIKDYEEQNKLGSEEAEILRRQAMNGIEKFTSSGAIIPEIEERTSYNPRLLMAPEPKLLTASPVEESRTGESTGIGTETQVSSLDIENLDEVERAKLLRRLLNLEGQGRDIERVYSEEPESESVNFEDDFSNAPEIGV